MSTTAPVSLGPRPIGYPPSPKGGVKWWWPQAQRHPSLESTGPAGVSPVIHPKWCWNGPWVGKWPVYKGCGERLRDRMGSTLVYKGCGESLEGVDPPTRRNARKCFRLRREQIIGRFLSCTLCTLGRRRVADAASAEQTSPRRESPSHAPYARQAATGGFAGNKCGWMPLGGGLI